MNYKYLHGFAVQKTRLCGQEQERRTEEARKEDVILDINDHPLEVDVIDSNQFGPKKFAGCKTPFEDTMVEPDGCLPGLDMVGE